ncbi:MAG: hypothetical protein KF754_01500 [Planctomycetes bacterium]|nr:hypothetical protein [Planctomycetota bacterium]
MTSIVRYRPKGIRPVALWDMPFEQGKFWQHVGAWALDQRRTAGEPDPSIAASFSAKLRAALPEMQKLGGRFDHLVLAGGITGLGGFMHEAGFARILPGAGFGPGTAGEDDEVVIDIGQTAVKVCRRGPGHSLVTALARDITKLPIITEEGRLTATEAREAGAAAVEFAAGALARGLATDAARVLMAMPVSIDDELVPGGCTYAGWKGDRQLVPRIVARASEIAGKAPQLVRVLNDAELAALAARKAGLCGPGRTLVVTLGFGPCGALVEDA